MGQKRAAGRRDHTYVGPAGAVHERAWLTAEEAHRTANRVFALTGRRYSAYECRYAGCGGFHIRPRRLRPADLAVPA